MPDPPSPNPPQLTPESDSTPAPTGTSLSAILNLDTAAIKAAEKKTASRRRKTVSGVVEKEKERAQSDHEKLLSALEVKWRDLEVRSFEQDIIERHRYATRIFILIVCWLFAILLILTFQGWSKFVGEFKLDNKVLLALIGGTTASVLALFTIVAKYLFSEKRPASTERHKNSKRQRPPEKA